MQRVHESEPGCFVQDWCGEGDVGGMEGQEEGQVSVDLDDRLKTRCMAGVVDAVLEETPDGCEAGAGCDEDGGCVSLVRKLAEQWASDGIDDANFDCFCCRG